MPDNPSSSTSSKDTDTAKDAKSSKAAAPAVGSLVTHTSTHWSGVDMVQTGIVVAVDDEAGSASVNWLPDAVAAVPFDALESVTGAPSPGR